MKANLGILALLLLTAGTGDVAGGPAQSVHWTYEGEEGPSRWAEIDPAFAACGAGKNQSPIDLARFVDADLSPIAFAYQPGGKSVVNNGHAVQVDYAPGSHIEVDGETFALKQFHFHVPSEHTVGGKSYPMEAHFVHVDPQGNLAVIGVLVEEGAANRVLRSLDPRVPGQAGEHADLSPPIDAADLLPEDRDYYRYSGSLTTPPCSEGVRWMVLKQPIHAAPGDIAPIAKAIGHPNNRPTLPAGARPVLD